jgi:hypothetical protein
MLRSGNDLRGLTIRATDDEIGTVDQFLFDDMSWTIRYMVVNAGGWLLRELVLISPRSIRGVAWELGQVAVKVDLSREQVKDAPEFDPRRLGRDEEQLLHSHYRREGYWEV